MGNEIDISKSNVVALTENTDLSSVLKPLTKEIHLFDTFVAGTSHISDKSVLDEVKPGDSLTLLRENNKFDEKAVLIKTKDGKKLGYIPEKDNIIFSRLMDAGKMLSAKITEVSKKNEDWAKIAIGIYLIDF
ncbi:MAG: HIRAN domain-containing protein [Candidatus Weimeria sp.]